MRRIVAPSLVFSLAIALAPLTAGAQILGADPLIVNVSPQYPQPYGTVTLTPTSQLLNLAASSITVTVNGKEVGKGTGGTSYSFQAGGPGSVAAVSMTVTGPDGTFKKDLSLRPSDVSLVAEPQTSVPPLYPGAPLISAESTVRLVAIADLRTAAGRMDPKTLVYSWKLGDQQLVPQSGVGQSILTVTAPLRYRDATVTVTVSDQANTAVGQASFKLSPQGPLVRIYEADPLIGPRFERALSGTFAMSGSEASFLAVPFAFSKAAAIAWTIGGKDASAGPVVTVRSTGNGAGSASLAANAGGGLVESASAGVSVSFSAGNSSGGGIGSLFGF